MTGAKLAVDIGGTFTDVVFRDHDGALATAKVPTTPGNIAEAVLLGTERAGATPSAVDVFIHGTTIALNALLERKTPPVGLVTTKGFRDVLEIMRTNRAYMYDLMQEKPTPLVPRRLRAEVSARMSYDGTPIRELELEEVHGVARAFDEARVASVAVCLLHSYADPRHELEIARELRERLPRLAVAVSSDLTREWREFERTSTTVVNAATMPIMSEYLSDLADRLHRRRFGGRLLIMQSNGGVTAASDARERPVASLMSGPAGAVAGAVRLARDVAGAANLVTLDIGGTSADVAVVDGGEATISAAGEVGGWPISVASLDIDSIGAGGGSIARVDPFGALAVGPESAGSMPGPACYGRGGTAATVTDAHVVLGRIDANQVLGGSVALDAEAARSAVAAAVAQPYGMTIEEAADGIVAVVNSNMTRLLWEMIIERGRDPRDFSLLALGGGGGLHACELAAGLGMRSVIVPSEPGTFSAHGMLAAEPRRDFSQTIVASEEHRDGRAIESGLTALEELARARFAEHDPGDAEVELRRSLELRYRGQRRGIHVHVRSDLLGSSLVDAAVAAFEDEHERLFGFRRVGRPVEIMTLRVSTIGTLSSPPAPAPVVPRTGPPRRSRPVYDGGRWREAAVLHRAELPTSFSAEGPCVVEEMSATTYVPPGWLLRVDADRLLHLSDSGERRE